jgi:hypothetical protein
LALARCPLYDYQVLIYQFFVPCSKTDISRPDPKLSANYLAIRRKIAYYQESELSWGAGKAEKIPIDLIWIMPA